MDNSPKKTATAQYMDRKLQLLYLGAIRDVAIIVTCAAVLAHLFQ